MQGGQPRHHPQRERRIPDARCLCGRCTCEDDGVDFAQRMKEIHKELLELQAESNRLMETISKNLEEMGV